MTLEELREEIDRADRELIAVFERRMAVSREIARYKIGRRLPVQDSAREEAVVEKAVGRVASPDIRPYVAPFYEAVLAASRSLQRRLMEEAEPAEEPAGAGEEDGRPAVAYLGMPGSFSEEAALACLGEGCRPRGVSSFEEIVEGVATGAWPMGVLPVENSLTGGVNVNIDLLMRGGVSVIGEQVLPVRHFLLGLPGAPMDGIDRALSHPQALEQCRAFLLSRGIESCPCGSTAEAARTVARQADPRQAAVASERAARLYGLRVLARDIQNGPRNYTRFVLIASRPVSSPEADKLSLMCVIDHTPGSLYRMLENFARHRLNLLHIASRPVPEEPWRYSFLVDIEGNLADGRVQAALDEVRSRCSLLRVLGNYRAWREHDGQ